MWGLFLCPACNTQIERKTVKGKSSNTCGKSGCRSKASTAYGSWNKDFTGPHIKDTPYYSSFSDYYRKLRSTNTVIDKWNTLSGFSDDMYTQYAKLRSSGIGSLTLLSNSKDVVSPINCKWVEDKMTNIDFSINRLYGIFHTRMLAAELSVRPYIVARTLLKMDKAFGQTEYTDVRISPTKVIKTYLLTKQQYVRLKDRISDNIKKKSSHLYLVQCGKFTKIGIASSVEKRVSAIRGSNPYEVKLVHSIALPNALYTEKHLHSKYKKFNHHHEWFTLTEGQVKEIIEYLDN